MIHAMVGAAATRLNLVQPFLIQGPKILKYLKLDPKPAS